MDNIVYRPEDCIKNYLILNSNREDFARYLMNVTEVANKNSQYEVELKHGEDQIYFFSRLCSSYDIYNHVFQGIVDYLKRLGLKTISATYILKLTLHLRTIENSCRVIKNQVGLQHYMEASKLIYEAFDQINFQCMTEEIDMFNGQEPTIKMFGIGMGVEDGHCFIMERSSDTGVFNSELLNREQLVANAQTYVALYNRDATLLVH